MRRTPDSALYLSLAVVIGVLFLFQSSAWAEMYRWRDDSGKLHFTNDSSNVPKKYRSKSRVKRKPGIAEPKSRARKSRAEVKEAGPGPTGEPAKGEAVESEAAEEGEALTEEEKMAMQKTIAFLDYEIQRDSQFKGSRPTINSGRAFAQGVGNDLPAKETLIESLASFELEAIKEAHDFLQASASRDKNMPAFIRQLQVAAEFDRMRSELSQKAQLKKKLKSALDKGRK